LNFFCTKEKFYNLLPKSFPEIESKACFSITINPKGEIEKYSKGETKFNFLAKKRY